MIDARLKTGVRTVLALLARPLVAVRLTVGRWITGEVTDTPEGTQTESRSVPATQPSESLVSVLSDGFGIKQETIERCIATDDAIREKVRAIQRGNASETDVEELHALLKQRLLYE